ncbi:MAG TPA: efflux RND transporter periplasmic adaptor subunit [Terriglobales bacterium]|nr:efflux RND transporter periplasmic adaptor subunit [Terriglobales bacterium]
MSRDSEKRPSNLLVICVLVCTACASCSLKGASRSDSVDVPYTEVEKTNVQIRVQTTGELRSTHSAMLTAPAIAGGTLQLVRLLKMGTEVKAGDVVFEFDPSEQEYNLEQNRSDYQQANQEIIKAKDDALVQAAQDQTALLKARFDVRQAELEVSKNDLVSAIDAQKNQLALDEANRALAQLRQDIQSHAASGQATVAVDEEKAHKAQLAMEQAEQNIKNMRVTSPIDGVVVVRQNQNASGGFFFSGMTLPDFQEGDQVNPGSAIADVIDVSQMEIAARVSESDRVNVKTGQQVEIRVDALPDKVFYGKVKTVTGSGVAFSFGNDSGKSQVTIQIDHADKDVRPGFTAHLQIIGEEVNDALWVPREAIFEKGGSPSVYARTEKGFEPRLIQIRYVTGGIAIVSGLRQGTQVAVVNPEQAAKRSLNSSGAGPTNGIGQQ